jgi:hypothetical protein
MPTRRRYWLEQDLRHHWPSTCITASMCCVPHIPPGADRSATFIPRSTGCCPFDARPHNPLWVSRSIGRPDHRPRGRCHPWEGRCHGTRIHEGWICAVLTTSEADVTIGRATFRSMGGSPPQDAHPHGLHPRRAHEPDESPSLASTPDGDVDPPYSQARRWAQRPAEIHRSRREYPLFLEL